MAYIITKTDGSELISVEDGSIDNTTSLTLIGRNYFSYGEAQNENFVKLLENFADTSPPATPLAGQLWFDKSPGVNKIKVFTGAAFKDIGSATVSPSQPALWSEGDFWLNSGTGQLYVKSKGTSATASAVLIGPFADPGLGKNGLEHTTLLDSSLAEHQIVKYFAGNDLLMVISRDTFTPSPALTNFPLLTKGVNVGSTSVLNVSSNDGIYWGYASQGNLKALSNIITIANRYVGGQIQFEVRDSGGSPSIPLTIDGATGFIGIQTVSPSAVLDVAGLIQTNTGLTITGGALTNNGTTKLNSSEDLANGAAVSLEVTTTYFSTGGSETATLAAGTSGLIKTFMMLADGGDMVITVTNPAWGGSGTMTFGDVGDGCTLQYIADKWFCIGNNGVVFA